MRKLLKTLLAISLLPMLSYAQSNYKPGYVITLKGDTLHGYINSKDWDSNPGVISFKKIATDKNTQKFTTSEISFFSVDGTSYQKYVGPISTDIINISSLSEARDTSYRIDTVFLQVLQKGKNVTLYSYSDNIKTRFYIGEQPGYLPTELRYRIYYNNSGLSDTKTVYERDYLKQLFLLANKYNVLDDNLTRVLQTAGYKKEDLLPIVSKINAISKSDYDKDYADHMNTDIYAAVGLNIFSASPKPAFSKLGYPSSTSVLPALAFGINLIPRPKSDKVELRAELLFAESRYAGVNLSKVSVVPQGIYNFYHAENLKIYLGFGFLISYDIYSSHNSSFVYRNAVSDAFMFKAGAKFGNSWEVFANTVTFPSDEFAASSSLKAFNEQIGLIYHFKL